MKKLLSRPNKLRTLRRRFGLTQRELAGLIGYRSESQISRLEQGSRMPGLAEAIKLEHLFRVSATTIFTRLRHTAVKELVHELERLNEDFQRSASVQPRVAYKAGLLADVLVSLRNQDIRAPGISPWSVTTVEEPES